MYLIFQIVASNLGFRAQPYQYAGLQRAALRHERPGPVSGRAPLFRAYWAAFAVILTVLSDGCGRRGTETGSGPAWRASDAAEGPRGAILAVAVLVFDRARGRLGC